MLHIFLVIIKIIGWIILAILGLLVLFICLVLFTPIRYQIRACCRGTVDTLDAEIKFSVFFHLISGRIQYKDGNMECNVRAAWKKITGGRMDEEISTGISAEGAETDYQSEKEPDTPSEKKPDTPSEKEIITPKKKEEVKMEPQKTLSASEVREPEKKGAAIFEKMKCTFRTFCDKINALLRKKDVLLDFVKDEVHQAVVCKAFRELKRLILKLKPERISGKIHFGFEDPCLTGYALAGVSMIYPMTGGRLEVQPDFEQKVLEGSLYVKGHVRAAGGVSLALRMIINRNVRTTVRDIKNFSFDA